jgi:hypothetical protein
MQRRNSGAGRHISPHQDLEPCVSGSRSWLGTSVLCSIILAFFSVVTAPASWAQDELEFSDLRVLIEINGTDGDAGFQTEIDGDAWKVVNLFDPEGRLIYRVRGFRSVGVQGLTENFFESAEPSCEDVPLDVVLGRFPEGEYEAEGRTIDGQEMEGEAILKHALPAIPVGLEADNSASVMLNWEWPGDNPGLGECPDEDSVAELLVTTGDLFGFQVVVGRENPEPLLELVVELGPEARTVDIPDSFIEAGARYKWEVIAIGAGVDPESEVIDPDRRGNQVIAEEEFCTEEHTGDVVVVDCPEDDNE